MESLWSTFKKAKPSEFYPVQDEKAVFWFFLLIKNQYLVFSRVSQMVHRDNGVYVYIGRENKENPCQ